MSTFAFSNSRLGRGALLVAVMTLSPGLSLWADVGSNNPTGTSGQYNGNIEVGVDPFTANATRSITDLVVAGGVGSYPLAFTRTMNSRYTPGLPVSRWPFGRPGAWNHSYGWSIDDAAVAQGRPASYTVNYPDARRIVFQQE